MNKNGRTGRKERRPAGEKKAEEEKEGGREDITWLMLTGGITQNGGGFARLATDELIAKREGIGWRGEMGKNEGGKKGREGEE